jgi:hypothetical protein
VIPFVLALAALACLYVGKAGWAILCAVLCVALVPTSSTAGSLVHSAAHGVASLFATGANFFG